MKKIVHDIICSDIKIIELKLKRIKLFKERLYSDKPSKLNIKKCRDWQLKLKELENEEVLVLKELQDAYIELERHLE